MNLRAWIENAPAAFLILALLAGMIWLQWAAMPAKGPWKERGGTVKRVVTRAAAMRDTRLITVFQVALDNGEVASVGGGSGCVPQYKAGDRIRLVQQPINSGGYYWRMIDSWCPEPVALPNGVSRTTALPPAGAAR
ncbi:hypothetical protein ACPVPU_03455 [Sphingomonas sp. CJ99]